MEQAIFFSLKNHSYAHADSGRSQLFIHHIQQPFRLKRGTLGLFIMLSNFFIFPLIGVKRALHKPPTVSEKPTDDELEEKPADDKSNDLKRPKRTGVPPPISNNIFLFSSGKYSDLTIECGGIQFKVHKSVVCTQSKFFSAACDGPFKEATEGIVRLPEDDPLAVWRMLTFLYTGDYDDYSIPPPYNGDTDPKSVRSLVRSLLEKTLDRSVILNNIDVSNIAHKYDHKPLADHALRKIKADISNALDTELLEGLSAASTQPYTAVPLLLSREILRRSTFKSGFNLTLRESEGMQNDETFWDILDAEPVLGKTLLREAMFQVAYFRHVAETNAKAYLEMPLLSRNALVGGPSCTECNEAPVIQYHPLAGMYTCAKCTTIEHLRI